jgi:hypothetical protein
MAWTITLLSPVVGDGTAGNAYRPLFSDDFPAASWSDVTGQDTANQPGDPSLEVIEVVTDDPGAIYANDTYFVLSEAEIPDGES